MIQRFAMSLRACGKLDCERVLGRARSSPKLIHLPKAVGRRKVGANADSDAEADEELEHGPMPLMPGYLLHSLAFIYTTEKGARVDEGFIGVGFVVGVPSTEH